MCFFFNDTATTEIYTLSLHDALPISERKLRLFAAACFRSIWGVVALDGRLREVVELAERFAEDRKSTRLNSSHANISYAVFCLKKKILSSLLLIHIPVSSSFSPAADS